MNKLISNPFECSYRNDDTNTCCHIDNIDKDQNNNCPTHSVDDNNFPINCPLQDGIPYKDTITTHDLLQIDEANDNKKVNDK